jgi:hypothetical protein
MFGFIKKLFRREEKSRTYPPAKFVDPNPTRYVPKKPVADLSPRREMKQPVNRPKHRSGYVEDDVAVAAVVTDYEGPFSSRPSSYSTPTSTRDSGPSVFDRATDTVRDVVTHMPSPQSASDSLRDTLNNASDAMARGGEVSHNHPSSGGGYGGFSSSHDHSPSYSSSSSYDSGSSSSSSDSGSSSSGE